MKKQESIPVAVVSAVLLLYIGLLVFSPRSAMAGVIYLTLPVLIVWTAYRVIRFGEYSGDELKEDEEWSYADKRKEKLYTF